MGGCFSDSDGAWPATLPEQGADIMRGQIEWLGRLLSARGMPRLLLARLAQEERFPPSWTQALNKALTALKRELFV